MKDIAVSLLIKGEIKEDWFDKVSDDGEYVRKDSQFRNWITPDGLAGISGEGGFEAEKDRYHLYVSYACPWAHRTLIFRKLKNLEDIISVSVVHPYMDNQVGTLKIIILRQRGILYITYNVCMSYIQKHNRTTVEL